jgi:hypothetical protein
LLPFHTIVPFKLAYHAAQYRERRSVSYWQILDRSAICRKEFEVYVSIELRVVCGVNKSAVRIYVKYESFGKLVYGHVQVM